MAFKLKSGNKVNFKNMGSSPVRNMKDGDYSQSFEKPGPPQATKFTHNWDGVDESKNTLERGSTGLTENKGFGGDATSLIQENKEKKDAINDAADGKGLKKDADGNVKTEETTESTAGAELKTTSDKYNPDGTLKEGDKKWHETDAFRDTGAGHITDAVKSIGRGIKNIREKRKAKKAERLTSAQEAVGSGTETLKQAKTVDRNRKKTANQEKRKAKSDAKDKKKLAEYRAKRKKIGEKLKSSVKKSKPKKANLKKGIVGPTIGGVGQTKFKDLSKTKIR
jgi:hypothetical protein